MKPGQERAGLTGLLRSDEQCQSPTGFHQARGDGQDGFEALNRAQGHDIKGDPMQGFCAGGLYIDIRQCKGADHLTQKSRLLVIGLNQRQCSVRRPQFDGQSRKTCTGAHISESHSVTGGTGRATARKQVPCGEEGFAEVTGYDLSFIADCRQVDTRVPAEKYIDIRRYTIQVVGRQNSRFLTAPQHRFGMTMVCGCIRTEERLQQFGDAFNAHGISDCRMPMREKHHRSGRRTHQGPRSMCERRGLASAGPG